MMNPFKLLPFFSNRPPAPAPQPAPPPPDPGRLGRHPLGTSAYARNAGPEPIAAGEMVMEVRRYTATAEASAEFPKLSQGQPNAPVGMTGPAARRLTPEQGADPTWTAGNLYATLLAEEQGANRDIWLFLSGKTTGFPDMVGPFKCSHLRQAVGEMQSNQPAFVGIMTATGLKPVSIGPPIFVKGNPINLMREAFACIADGCKAATPDSGLWLTAMTESLHRIAEAGGGGFGDPASNYKAPAPAGGIPGFAAGPPIPLERAVLLTGAPAAAPPQPPPGFGDDPDDDDSDIDSDVEADPPAVEVPAAEEGPLATATVGDVLGAMAGYPDTSHVHILNEPGTAQQQPQCVQTVGGLRATLARLPAQQPLYFPAKEAGRGLAIALPSWAPEDFVAKYHEARRQPQNPSQFWLLTRPSKLPAA